MRSLFLAVLGGLGIGGACCAVECRVAIPLERLVVSGDGMAMLDEDDGVIELENLYHGEEGFYTLCQVDLVDSEELVLACSPGCLARVIERYLSDPDVAEQLLEKITCEGDVAGRGGAKQGAAVGRVVVEDKEKKVAVEFEGEVRHGYGQTEGSGQVKVKRPF